MDMITVLHILFWRSRSLRWKICNYLAG